MATDELLTKDEMDALMEGVARGRVDTGPWTADGNDDEVLPYDLVSAENALAPIMPVLETINERFIHQMRAGLFDLLRREVDITPGSIEIRGYNDLITALEAPASANVIRIHPLAGPGLLVFEQKLVFMAVDAFFGGKGKVYSHAVNREFTATEQRLVRRLLNLVFNALAGAWRPFLEVQCSHQGAESNPQFLSVINPAETLAVTSLSLNVEEIGGSLYLALPCSMFEPVREQLRATLLREHPSPSDRLSRLLREGVKGSRVDLRCLLAETELSLRDLLSLREGDVIPVDVPTEAVLEAENIPIYSGHYGVARGYRALRISRVLRPLESLKFEV